MLTEKQLEAAIARITGRIDEVNRTLIKKIAAQILKIGQLNPTSINRILAMSDLGADIRDISRELAEATELNVRDIYAIYNMALRDSYTDPRFATALKSRPLSPMQNDRLRMFAVNTAAQTAATMRNLSNTTAILPAYREAVDKAITAVSMGGMSYNEAARDIIRDLGYNGLQVQYESGYHRRLDTAVRQNIIDGVNQINQNASLAMGEMLGYDAVEISAHANSAPDHEPVQGRVFLLTILQRRLASSPEAIYQSLHRRRGRLEQRLREEQLGKRVADMDMAFDLPDNLDEMDDLPSEELEEAEARASDRVSAARTIEELKAEIETLRRLEAMANNVRMSGTDKKWEQLSSILQDDEKMFDPDGQREKLIIFTEHRDTLNYLAEKIRTLFGKDNAVVTIHGGMLRDERRKVETLFKQDKDVRIMIATDAAGEGINLQRAHLMVNYDLPWNPNRIEQRFGRIHRIGQTEVCHLWNLISKETREGAVYQRLFEKLDEGRKALGGKVFDILGYVTFDNRPLRDLLIEAIRYGNQPETKARLYQVVDKALNRQALRDLIEGNALTEDTMDVHRVMAIREEMERMEAHKLQPHFIEAFFIEAFTSLGGVIRKREEGRYEIISVPYKIRNRDQIIGFGTPVAARYERI